LPVRLWQRLGAESGRETVTCLRSVLMKAEHREWMPEVLVRLRRAAQT